MNDYTMADLDEGMRVEIHPGLDAWMQGDRFGTIWRLGRKLAHVKMDRSGRVLKLDPRWIHEVIQSAAERNVEQAARRRTAAAVAANPFDGRTWFS